MGHVFDGMIAGQVVAAFASITCEFAKKSAPMKVTSRLTLRSIFALNVTVIPSDKAPPARLFAVSTAAGATMGGLQDLRDYLRGRCYE